VVLDLVTEATSNPVSLSDAKEHLRVDHTDEDEYITRLIDTARRYCEKLVNKAFITQTWDCYFDDFPGTPFELPLPPVQTVSSIIYTNSNGTATTVQGSTYTVDKVSHPARINLAYSKSWPTATLQTLNAIKIRYITGYGDKAANVPEDYRQAILILVAHLFENREQTTDIKLTNIPFSIYDILGIDRIITFP
jgi:uncharacterized phiE125 gp8 family phage protein